MANKGHLALLEQGMEAWNRWRRDIPAVRLNLSRTTFVGAHLRLLAILSLGTVGLIVASPLWQ
jgi:hypothetical protein